MGEALIQIYLEAFHLEGRVPEHSDEAALTREIELLFAGRSGISLIGLPIGGNVQAVEDRILQLLHANVHEMRLRANLPKESTYTFNGDVTGGVSMGPGTTQNIKINDEAKSRSNSES